MMLPSWLTRKSTTTSTTRWPYPEYNVEKEPHFFFILTPPYSGSTALAQILNTSHKTAFLQKKAEGQWLIPGMCEPDRWTRDKRIDWESVRAVWLQRIELLRSLTQNVELIIEKSPPNIVRIDKLLKVFPNHSLMAFNRNPYANCASVLYRLYEPTNKSEEDRVKLVSGIASEWLFRSEWIKTWIDEWDIVKFNYEEFCASPTTCISNLSADIPALQTVDVNKRIKVKDYELQKLVNLNSKQISKLTAKEINAISAVLAKNPELVSYFGYDIKENWTTPVTQNRSR